MVSENKMLYNKQYKRENEKRVLVSFFPKDKALYEHVCKQKSKSAYIRSLIMRDMGLTEDDLGSPKKRVYKPLPDQKKWASMKEACELTGLSRSSIYFHIRSGKLVSRKVNNRVQIERKSLKKFMSSKR